MNKQAKIIIAALVVIGGFTNYSLRSDNAHKTAQLDDTCRVINEARSVTAVGGLVYRSQELTDANVALVNALDRSCDGRY